MKTIFFTLSALLVASACVAARLHPERFYQDTFAREIDGKMEVRAGDGTMCDILTESHAIEVDFANKWGEAIGQCLNYGFQFNRKAGIVLILEDDSDYKFLIRVTSIIEHYKLPIDVWEIKPTLYNNDTLDSAKNGNTKKEGAFWISSTGKTHKYGCRYFGNGRGQYSEKPTEENCKFCGGPQ